MTFSAVTVYENFTLNNPVTTLSIIIWGLYAGFIVAGFSAYYNKVYLGEIIRRLVKKGASSKETAVSFGEAGIKAGLLRRKAVFGDTVVAKYVILANRDDCVIEMPPYNPVVRFLRRLFLGKTDKAPVKYDISQAKFFVLEEKRIQAELRFEEKGNSLPFLLIGALIFFVIGVALTMCIPYILDLVDSVITLYKGL